MTSKFLWLLLPALLTVIYVGTLVEYPLDFWHNVTTGRQIVQMGTVPDRDAFTCTIAGRPVTNQCWLAQWAFYELFQGGGFPLVQFVVALGYGAAAALITAAAWRRAQLRTDISQKLTLGCAVFSTVGLVLVSLALAASNFGIRTQVISFILFAAELYALWRWPGRWGLVLLAAAVEVLWTNTHGAFPLGILLPGVFLAAAAWDVVRKSGWRALPGDRSVRVFAACVAVAALAAFCNPHPLQTLDYVGGVTSKASERGIDEWLPVSLNSYTGIAMALGLAAAAVILYFSPKRIEPLEWLLLIVFVVPALRHQRMVVWWAMILPSVLTPHLEQLVASWKKNPGPSAEKSWKNIVVLVALLAVTALATPWTRRFNPLLPPAKRNLENEAEPSAAARFIRQIDYRGNVFNPMEWGAYLTWRLDPQVKVFIDGRIDFFPDKIWTDYSRIGDAEAGWETLLNQYRIDLVVWNRQMSPKLPEALRQSKKWRNVYEDSLSTIFQRRGPSQTDR
jgi:hypothetical protein